MLKPLSQPSVSVVLHSWVPQPRVIYIVQHPRFLESGDVEPADTEGQLYRTMQW